MAVKDLAAITKAYGTKHKTKKNAEAVLKKKKEEFYEAATTELAKQTLAQKTIEVPDSSTVADHIEKYYPGWRLHSIKDSDEGLYTIEENPALQRFLYVNTDDGLVYQRNITEGTPSLDDERLLQEDPDLWMKITTPSEGQDTLEVFRDWAEGDLIPQLVQQFIDEMELPRELKPLAELQKEEQAALAEYIVPGPLSPRMEAPREAKPEELEGE